MVNLGGTQKVDFLLWWCWVGSALLRLRLRLKAKANIEQG